MGASGTATRTDRVTASCDKWEQARNYLHEREPAGACPGGETTEYRWKTVHGYRTAHFTSVSRQTTRPGVADG
jgi:hypothetical protein